MLKASCLNDYKLHARYNHKLIEYELSIILDLFMQENFNACSLHKQHLGKIRRFDLLNDTIIPLLLI
jgi:hypothetical protein